MSGTVEGGKAAARACKSRFGENFYAEIGALGGKNGHTGGFAKKEPCDCNIIKDRHTIPQCAGVKGGTKSRRPQSQSQ